MQDLFTICIFPTLLTIMLKGGEIQTVTIRAQISDKLFSKACCKHSHKLLVSASRPQEGRILMKDVGC